MRQIFILILLCLTLIVIWFHKGLIFAGGEEGIPFYDLEKTVRYYSSIWHESGTGFPAVNIQRIPIFKLLSIFYNIGIPGFALQAFLFFLLMSVGTVSVYFLIKETVLKDLNEDSGQKKYQYLPLIAGIFYLLNPFSMTQIWGRGLYMQFFPFALFPLFLTLFIVGIRKNNIVYGIIALLSSVVLSAAFDNISYVFSLWFLIFTYALLHIIRHINERKEIIFTIGFFVFMFAGWLLLHSFWILPFLNLSIQPYVAITENPEHGLGSLRGVSRQYPLHVLIRLMHSGYFFEDLYGKVYSGFIFGIISWIIPLVSIFSVKKFKKLLHFQYFGVLFLIGLFISLGSNFPSGWLFELLFKYIPFFQMFRNPFEKFGLIFLIAYVPFFALGTVIVAQKIGRLFKKETAIFLSIAVIIVLVCGIYLWPMWTGIFAGGYRLNPWVKVPDDYKLMEGWLNAKDQDYRVFMTPVWSGDGTFYQWGNTRFQGTDPMVYLINQPAVSYGSQLPILLSIRKNMERINMAPVLELFRAKYLINRGDAVMVTETEKQHSKFLTGFLYPPIGVSLSNRKICQDIHADSKANGIAWITCQIPDTDSDWSKARYAHFTVKTDVPSFLEFALSDKNGTRIRWYGPLDAEYQTDDINETVVTVPLSAPTEYNPAIDFSKVDVIEVLAHPKDFPQLSSGEISLKEIALDPGKEEQLNNFRLVETFGRLQVYEPLKFNPLPEFGSLLSTVQVKDMVALFKEADRQKDQIDRVGFVMKSQNAGKNLQELTPEAALQVISEEKISDSRYWLEVNKGESPGFIILSKTFNPQWKLIPGISRKNLAGGFFGDVALLKKAVLPEEQHFVVNGYANLWKVNGGETGYAVVFMPQIFADIGRKVSISGILIILGFSAIWGVGRTFLRPPAGKKT